MDNLIVSYERGGVSCRLRESMAATEGKERVGVAQSFAIIKGVLV
jgi:hypothetical protein